MNILRRADVATKLGIHPVTLDRWVREKVFSKPFYISGNRPVWDEEDVNTWLVNKKQSTGEANGTEGKAESLRAT